MKQLRKTVLVASLLGAVGASAQIPVTDIAHITQNATNQAANIAKYVEQIAQLKNQLQHMQRTYDAMTGSRGMGGLINDPSSRHYLPSDYQSMLSSVSTGTGDLSGLASRILANNAVLNADQLAVLNPSTRQIIAQQRAQSASQSAAAQMAFQQASQRFTTLQTLIDSIDRQTDPKAIQDLQARIQAESVMLQNEKAKLDAMASANAVQKQIDLQRDQERELQFINTRPPRF
jgi:type IV secretion system protein VirB5